jgi:hypothetical protein
LAEKTPDTKPTVIAAIDDSWKELRRALGSLSAADMEAPGVTGDWTPKDVLGHITTWEAELLAVVASGQQKSYPDLDGFNQQAVKSKRKLDAREVLAQLEETHRALRDGLAAAPAAYFEKSHPVRRSVDADTVEHYDEHVRSLREWARSPRR